MENLLNLHKRNNVKVVYARELYLGLGFRPKHFIRWSDLRIVNNPEYTKDVDWFFFKHIPATSKDLQRKRKVDDYAITLKVARELVWASRSELDYEVLEKYHTFLIEADGGLRNILKGSTQEFVDNLSLDPRRLQSQLIRHITYKNVEDIIPLLLKRIEDDLCIRGKGKNKISLLNAIDNALEKVASSQETLAKKDIINEQLKAVKDIYKRTAQAKVAADTRVAQEKLARAEEMIKEQQELIDSLNKSEEDINAEMNDLRMKINSAVRTYSMNYSIPCEELFLDLYDEYFFQTGIDITEEYKRCPSYLMGIQSEGHVDVLRDLYELARTTLK